MLEEFLNHRLAINTKGATIDDLKELDKIINLSWASGDKLYEIYTNTNIDRFLYSNGAEITFSYYLNSDEKCVSYADFIDYYESIEVSFEEFNRMFEV